MKITKAFLLAAGLGTRLKPLTDQTPKCLIQIEEKPLLVHWLDLLAEHGVSDVLVNTHYLAEQVNDYLSIYKGRVQVQIVHEPVLLGSAGTVLKNKDFVKNEESFLIAYADNLTNVNLSQLFEVHQTHAYPLTIGLFVPEAPKQCGIAQLNAENVITDFEEKPANPPQEAWANAGLYVAQQTLFEKIPACIPADFGFNVLPQFKGQMQGVKLQGYLRDIGTMENLNRARLEWSELTQ